MTKRLLPDIRSGVNPPASVPSLATTLDEARLSLELSGEYERAALSIKPGASHSTTADKERELLEDFTKRAQNAPLDSTDLQFLIALLALRLCRVLDQPQDATRILAYAERLADLDQNVLLLVFERAEKECRFFPIIPDLRDWARELAAQPERSTEQESRAGCSRIN